MINVLRSLSGSAKATVNGVSSFSQTVMGRLEIVIRMEACAPHCRRAFWRAEHPLLARALGDLGYPLSWGVAEIGGFEGELLRVGMRYYRSHVLVTRIVPGTNIY